MKKYLFLLSFILLWSCQDVENSNFLDDETKSNIEEGVKQSDMYKTGMENIASEPNWGPYLEVYFVGHRKTDEEFDKSAFGYILNRRIHDNEDNEQYYIQYHECKDKYQQSAYQVDLSVYLNELNPNSYEYKQVVMLDKDFNVIETLCYPHEAPEFFPCN